MKQVIVFPRGQLNAKDKERLTKAGIVAVEADDPSKVVTILPTSGLIVADDLLMAAMQGVTNPGYGDGPKTMVKELHRRLSARDKAAGNP